MLQFYNTERTSLSLQKELLKIKRKRANEGVCARESRHAARLPSRLPGAAPPFLPCLRARQEGDDYPVRPAVYDPLADRPSLVQQTHTHHTNIERENSLSLEHTRQTRVLLSK